MLKNRICIYEDDSYNGFGPLVETRAIWDLRCGAFTFAEKFIYNLPGFEISFGMRVGLRPLYRGKGLSLYGNENINEGSWLFLKGNTIFDTETMTDLINCNEDSLFLSDGDPVAFRLSNSNLKMLEFTDAGSVDYSQFGGLSSRTVQAHTLDYPWQLVNRSRREISADFNHFIEHCGSLSEFDNNSRNNHLTGDIKLRGSVDLRPGICIDAEQHTVLLEEGVRIGPGVIIDAANGPVWIAQGASVEAGAVIMGPVYIGPQSIIRRHARLYNGVSLGPQCRVGGEVSNSVMQGYSNKQHSGYLGTSYVGSWVNIGAGTENSDLKNNYRPITVNLGNKIVDAAELHVGVFLGDYCCTAIQTRLNSGTVAGVCCNLFGLDFPEKFIPSFTWYSSDSYQEYNLEKAIETIRTIMRRRQVQLTPELEKLLREIFENSQTSRQDYISD